MIIVTKQKALVDYIYEIGLVKQEQPVTILDYVSDYKVIQGHDVIGVLPNFISCHARSITEIPIVLPRELRGKELTIEQIRQYARKPRRYIISQVVGG